MKFIRQRLGIVSVGLSVLQSPLAEPNVVLYDDPTGAKRCEFSDEGSILAVKDGDSELARYEYCSSYGSSSSSAQIYTDARGTIYILLLHAEGRGTCAMERQHLSVLGFKKLSLQLSEYAKVPDVSWPTDANCAMAGYDIQASTQEAGGLEVKLVPPNEDLELIVISVDADDS